MADQSHRDRSRCHPLHPGLYDRDTLVLASETEIGFHKPGRGETRIYALSEARMDKKFEVTSATVNYWVGRSGSLIQTGTLLLMYTLPLLMYFGLWIGYLVYSLLGALVVWLAAHLRGTAHVWPSLSLDSLPPPSAICRHCSSRWSSWHPTPLYSRLVRHGDPELHEIRRH